MHRTFPDACTPVSSWPIRGSSVKLGMISQGSSAQVIRIVTAIRSALLPMSAGRSRRAQKEVWTLSALCPLDWAAHRPYWAGLAMFSGEWRNRGVWSPVRVPSRVRVFPLAEAHFGPLAGVDTVHTSGSEVSLGCPGRVTSTTQGARPGGHEAAAAGLVSSPHYESHRPQRSPADDGRVTPRR